MTPRAESFHAVARSGTVSVIVALPSSSVVIDGFQYPVSGECRAGSRTAPVSASSSGEVARAASHPCRQGCVAPGAVIAEVGEPPANLLCSLLDLQTTEDLPGDDLVVGINA